MKIIRQLADYLAGEGRLTAAQLDRLREMGLIPPAVAEEPKAATFRFGFDESLTHCARNLGTCAPPVGTYLIAHRIGDRWVFRYDG